MERVAATLQAELRRHHADVVSAERVAPPFVHAARRLGAGGDASTPFNVDRFLSRFWRYPRHAASLRGRFDVFHVIDHSYAHLVHALPPARTVVTCHDLDAFRSMLAPAEEPRSAAFRAVTRRIASGLGRAARVVCDTDAVRRELVAAGLAEARRAVVAPLGVDDVFFDQGRGGFAPADDRIEILHVGSTAPRKRVDVLLRVCGALMREHPTLRLTRVGDPLTADQRRLAEDAGVAGRLVELGTVDEATLASRYRAATLVLQPSDREGFGLPVLEALASGTPVVASDLPVLREVGAAAVTYCPAGEVGAWSSAVGALLRERACCPARWAARRDAGRAHARGFTWVRFGAQLVDLYQQVAAEHA